METNQVIEAIVRRRSVRKFTEEQVKERDLEQILWAGRHAPSGSNRQESGIFVIRDAEVLQKLDRMVERLFAEKEVTEDMYVSLRASISRAKKGNYHFFYNAPTLIVITNKKGHGNAMADSAAVIENMLLAASAIGVGSCWINQLKWLREEPEVEEFMTGCGMLPDETVYGGLALGFAEETVNLSEPLPRTGNRVVRIG